LKIAVEKKIQLFNKIDTVFRCSEEDDLTELERLTLSNRKEWQMSHLPGLIEHENLINKLIELTKRIHRLEELIEVEEE
jgi:hypothetical protein